MWNSFLALHGVHHIARGIIGMQRGLGAGLSRILFRYALR